jgi:hypothetical protein
MGQTHAVLVLNQGGVATSELLFNSGTSCYGANVVQVRMLIAAPFTLRLVKN